jgi:ferric-dicitrate binding protein FerR (iron transport regulator)
MDTNLRELLVRYVQGNCTPDEIAAVNSWYRRIEDEGLELEDSEKTVIEERMLRDIRRSVFSERSQKEPRRHMLFPSLLKIAAVLTALAVFGVWFFVAEDSASDNSPVEASALSDFASYENNTGGTRLFELPDGSTVQMEASAKIYFRKNFLAPSREVYLTGKGFFNVVKDASRPFYVYSGKIAIRVLGTSFFVDASAFDKCVSVKVVTGEVSVFEIMKKDSSKKGQTKTTGSPRSNGVVLTPNQRVEYFVDGGHWVTGLVDEPVPVKSLDGRSLSFVFANTSIREVLEDIRERYGIEVVVGNERIANCTFTGDVSQMPLYDLLDVVCTAIQSSYELKGTRILISGKGCQ